MSAAVLDAPLLHYTDDAWVRPLPAALAAARTDLRMVAADILAIREDALEREWPWIGGGEEAVRYGMYRVYEVFERAEVDAARRLRESGDGTGGRLAAALVAPATAARWDLHAVLAPLADADIDADPGGGEWSMRQTLGHIVNGQRAYGWSTGWWVQQRFALDDPGLPPSVPEDFWNDLPDEDGPEQEGSLDEIRTRLDATLDGSAERLAGLPEVSLGLGARWSGFAVPVSFRLGRWSSHIREHTLQIDKTLAMLGRSPSEPERVLRLVFGAYGRAEAVVFGHSDADAAGEIIRAAATEAREVIADARRTAEA
jgi:hypothetical protein